MKRALLSLFSAALLAAIAVAPVGAARATGFFGISPACYVPSWDGLQVYINWSGQTPGAGDLVLNLDFNAKKTTTTYVNSYVAPIQPSAFSPTLFQKFQVPGVTDWNSITSLNASVSGAFVATAKTVRQPHGGWPTC